MSIRQAIRNLVGAAFTHDNDYVVVRNRHVEDYELDGYTKIGPVEGTRGVTGAHPMVAMQRPEPPKHKPVIKPLKPTPEPIKPEGGLGHFLHKLGGK